VSFRSLLNRTVALSWPTKSGAPPARDEYGNVVVTPSEPHTSILARRDQIAADENVDNRDQQTRRYLYLLPMRDTEGDPFDPPAGRGWIIDGDETLLIEGEPELVHRRRRPHHWEVRVVVRTG
jgi:hypothetical protein